MDDKQPNFSALTDAELDRWIAERDGWSVGRDEDDKFYCVYAPHFEKSTGPYCDNEAECWASIVYRNAYTRSADSAIALAGRWGYEWNRFLRMTSPTYIGVRKPETRMKSSYCNENPEHPNPFARALSEALASAKARERE